jgi:hypothetical protein
MSQGQASSVAWPTARRKQMSASVAVGGSVPLGAQIQIGVHTTEPTAAFKMNGQSLAVGCAPDVNGCAQFEVGSPAATDDAAPSRAAKHTMTMSDASSTAAVRLTTDCML